MNPSRRRDRQDILVLPALRLGHKRMILEVCVIPKAGRNLVVKKDGTLKAYLTKPAQDGLANAQLIDLLSDYLQVKKYRLRIIKGHKSRNKLVEVA